MYSTELPKNEIIFDGPESEAIPSGFTSRLIRLDLTLNATLNWKKEKELAKEAESQGNGIVFELDLGLFDRLAFPLENDFQFLAFERAFEGVKEELLDPFSKMVRAVVLYRGSLDFSCRFPFSEILQKQRMEFLEEKKAPLAHPFFERLFARNFTFDYLNLLSRTIAAYYPLAILVDARPLDPMDAALTLFGNVWEPFDPYVRGLKNSPRVWELGVPGNAYIGSCLPRIIQRAARRALALPADLSFPIYEKAKNWIEKQPKEAAAFRLVEQESLTTLWEDLDTLSIFSEYIDEDTERKLQGFLAAGGEVIRL